MSSQYTLLLGALVFLAGVVQMYFEGETRKDTLIQAVGTVETYAKKFDGKLIHIEAIQKVQQKAIADITEISTHFDERMDKFETNVLGDADKMSDRIDRVRDRVELISDDLYQLKHKSKRSAQRHPKLPTQQEIEALRKTSNGATDPAKPVEKPEHKVLKRGIENLIPVETK